MGFGEMINQVWTIARHSIIQALRMKIVIVLGVFLIVLVPALPFLLKSDDTQIGQIKMVLTYSVYLTSLLLSVMTLFLSVAVLSGEIKGRQIFMLDPKPVPRFVVLVGKWVGVMLINLALLAGMLGATYGLVRYLGRPHISVNLKMLRPTLERVGAGRAALDEFFQAQKRLFAGHLSEEDRDAFDAAATRVLSEISQGRYAARAVPAFQREVERLMADAQTHQNVKAQMLTAREAATPPLPNLDAWVDATVREMQEKNVMPEKRSEAWVRQRLAEQYSRAAWQVPPNYMQKWVIGGIPKFDGWLVIRFRFYKGSGSVDHQLPCLFEIVGPPGRQALVPPPGPNGEPGTFRVDKVHTFAVKSNLVRDDGTIEIRFHNKDREGVEALFPFQDGIRVLYPRASLALNFFRTGLVILMKLAMIGIVGIFAATFLSFPVGVLLTIYVFVQGHMADYVITEILSDLYVFGTSMVPPGTPMETGDVILRNALKGFLDLFPNFGGYDVVPSLSEGFLVPGAILRDCFVWMVLLRGSVLTAAAWFIYRRRELAAVTPQT